MTGTDRTKSATALPIFQIPGLTRGCGQMFPKRKFAGWWGSKDDSSGHTGDQAKQGENDEGSKTAGDMPLGGRERNVKR